MTKKLKLSNPKLARIILLGTPKFSVPIFEEVIKNFNVVAIVSQPDRPFGRGYKLKETPTKLLAKKYNIKLFQPIKISELKKEITDLKPDIILTCAFGQYVPTFILSIPKFASLNIHGSLLPRHRGASPIQYSILSGDKEAGLTLMFMEKEMDSGDMIFTIKINTENKNAGELFDELSIKGANIIVLWLNKFLSGNYIRKKQDASKVTFAPKIEKSFGEINNKMSINEALLKIRALNPFPGTYCIINKKKYKIFKAQADFSKDTLPLNVKDGKIYILEIQSPGRKRISAKEFLKGYKNGKE